MTDTVETIYTDDKLRRVRIEYDMDGSHCDPREDEGIVEIVTPYLRNWNVRTDDAHFQSEHDRLYEKGLGGAFGRYLKIFHGVDAMPVFMYEHSNVALSARSFIGRAQHAEWDSGMIGWAYIKPDTEKWEGMEPEKVISSFVETLGQWMNGEVYGYIVEKLVTGRKVFDDGTPDEEFEEWVDDEQEYTVSDGQGGWRTMTGDNSCWGYIGLKWAIQAARTEGLGLPDEEGE